MRKSDQEHHLLSRINWLRAAVLGANDGVISTASLMMGVAAAAHSTRNVLISGSRAWRDCSPAPCPWP